MSNRRRQIGLRSPCRKDFATKRSRFHLHNLLLIVRFKNYCYICAVNPLKPKSPMSKITLNAVIMVLRLALSLFGKIIRLLYSVIDLVDDGCLNSSAPVPDWIITLRTAISSLESLRSHVSGVTEQAESEL